MKVFLSIMVCIASCGCIPLQDQVNHVSSNPELYHCVAEQEVSTGRISVRRSLELDGRVNRDWLKFRGNFRSPGLRFSIILIDDDDYILDEDERVGAYFLINRPEGVEQARFLIFRNNVPEHFGRYEVAFSSQLDRLHGDNLISFRWGDLTAFANGANSLVFVIADTNNTIIAQDRILVSELDQIATEIAAFRPVIDEIASDYRNRCERVAEQHIILT